jgi:hypothetical protein
MGWMEWNVLYYSHKELELRDGWKYASEPGLANMICAQRASSLFTWPRES